MSKRRPCLHGALGPSRWTDVRLPSMRKAVIAAGRAEAGRAPLWSWAVDPEHIGSLPSLPAPSGGPRPSSLRRWGHGGSERWPSCDWRPWVPGTRCKALSPPLPPAALAPCRRLPSLARRSGGRGWRAGGQKFSLCPSRRCWAPHCSGPLVSGRCGDVPGCAGPCEVWPVPCPRPSGVREVRPSGLSFWCFSFLICEIGCEIVLRVTCHMWKAFTVDSDTCWLPSS